LSGLLLVLGVLVVGCGRGAPDERGRDARVGRLGREVASVTKEDVKASLEKGGYRIVQVNEASAGANRTFGVAFSGHGTKGTVEVLASPSEVSRLDAARGWEEKRAAFVVSPPVVMAVDLGGDRPGAQKLLDGMIGK
jgi:hypothetical protein